MIFEDLKKGYRNLRNDKIQRSRVIAEELN